MSPKRKMDKEIRVFAEEQIDAFVDDPIQWYKIVKASLIQAGIDPNLEHAISCTVGYLMGICSGKAVNIQMNKENFPKMMENLLELLHRRMDELRIAYQRAKSQ